MPERKTQEQYIQECRNIHGDKYILDNVVYYNQKSAIVPICRKHGEWVTSADAFIHSKIGCPKCAHKYMSRSQDEFILECMRLHGDKYDLSKIIYKNKRTRITPICKIHGEWNTIAHSFVCGSGCPKCKKSKGEGIVQTILKEKCIAYDFQKKFDGCISENGKSLKFDFYLPHENICIEYDGEQHYRPVEHFGGKNGFIRIKMRDSIKNDYCKNNNIRLFRVSYTMSVEEIQNLIDSIVSV
jgi:hypothetical protein